MTDDQTLKLSPIFNRCLLDLEAIGNFDFLSGDREQAMQVLMDAVDAAVNVVNNPPMSEIDVEIGKLEDRVVEAAVAWREMRIMQGGTHRSLNELMEATNALIAAREKAEQQKVSLEYINI